MKGARLQQASLEAGELYNKGEIEQAEQLARDVLKHDRKSTHAMQVLGLIAFDRRNFAEAESLYKKCLRIAPHSARFHYLLGKVYAFDGHLDDAIKCFETAASLKDDYIDAIIYKGVALDRIAQPVEALKHVQPLIDRGVEHPDLDELLARLAMRDGRFDEALSLVDRQLEREDLMLPIRQGFCFQRAEILEKAGRYDEAFEAYQFANDLIAISYDMDIYVQMIDRLISAFSAETLATLPRAANESDTPIIVAGMPRSGTTLIEQILIALPQVHGAGEIRILNEIQESISSSIDTERPYPECITDLTQRTVDGFGRKYINHTTRLNRKADRIVNKNINNFLHLGLVELFLPRAKVIHCRRDALDTCTSIYFNRLSPQSFPYSTDLEKLGIAYCQYERVMQHWDSVLQIPILHIEYEELVEQQESTTRRILDFCGVPWDDRALRFYEADRFARTLSHEQVRRPIYRTSVQRWKHHEQNLAPLREVLVDD